MTINGVVQQGADPMVGFPVPNIPVGQTSTITFQVTVTSIPSGGNIRNQSNVTASFLINPANPPITTVTNSNFVVTQVNTAQLNIQNLHLYNKRHLEKLTRILLSFEITVQ